MAKRQTTNPSLIRITVEKYLHIYNSGYKKKKLGEIKRQSPVFFLSIVVIKSRHMDSTCIKP